MLRGKLNFLHTLLRLWIQYSAYIHIHILLMLQPTKITLTNNHIHLQSEKSHSINNQHLISFQLRPISMITCAWPKTPHWSRHTPQVIIDYTPSYSHCAVPLHSQLHMSFIPQIIYYHQHSIILPSFHHNHYCCAAHCATFQSCMSISQ